MSTAGRRDRAGGTWLAVWLAVWSVPVTAAGVVGLVAEGPASTVGIIVAVWAFCALGWCVPRRRRRIGLLTVVTALGVAAVLATSMTGLSLATGFGSVAFAVLAAVTYPGGLRQGAWACWSQWIARTHEPQPGAAGDDRSQAARAPATSPADSSRASDRARRLGELSDTELGRHWRFCSVALHTLQLQGDGTHVHAQVRSCDRCQATLNRQIRLVEERQACLDEIERRDPDAFRRWLAADARPASDPTRYLRSD